jgi:hypothetical protein
MGSMYVFSFNLNSRTNLNNGRLSGVKAMPAKDLTSDSDSAFASDRKAYANILATDTATPGPHQISQKKWIGGSRDASDIAYRRRVSAAGSSMNPSGGAFSYTSKTEKNTVINALNRCRNQGNCVPPKVRASPHYTNLLTPIWKPPNLMRTKFHAVLTKETPMTHKKINTVNGFS